MSKNTKDKKQLFVIILLLVVLVTASCLGMYAWARYQTITNGSAQGQVAKWSFKVNGEETKFATINLAETLNFQNVAEGRIAPGTNGAFDLVIDASGTEVSLDYFITIDASERPTNMKFYKDSAKQQPLTINSDEKLVFDGEILLENINTPVTKTIYWDWPYETTTRPTQIVKTSEENEAKIVAELKKVAKLNNVTLEGTETANEIIAKLNTANVKSVDINDAIDTAESGRIVTLPITVVGEQQGVNAEGFKQNGIEVTSDKTKTYSAGDVVELTATFNDDVYGGEGRVAMTSATAPVLKIEFAEDTITTGSNNKLIAKVATTGNVIRLGAVENEKTRTATFAGVEGSKIKYTYTVQEDDSGKMQIVSFTGDVYNKKGSKITVETKEISGEQKITVENFAQGSIEVVSPSGGASATCSVADEVIVQANFSIPVYGGANQTAINESNAPELKVKFGTGTEQVASYVGLNENGTGIQYKVKPTKDDRGALTVTSYTGNVYNATGTQCSVTRKDILAEKGITAIELTVTIGGTQYTEATIAEKYGKLVDYNTGSSTFRLFYVDFNNEFGDGYGTIYLKSDQVKTTELTNYTSYNSKNTKYFKQLNSLWASSSISTIDQKNEKAASWLADPTVWTKYGNNATNSNVNYAIGAPTVELYLASYNKSFGKNYKCRIGGSGYQYSTDGGSSYATTTANNTISTGKNGMYCKSGQSMWLASPSAYGPYFVCGVSGSNFSLYSNGYANAYGAYPLVSLKSNTPLNFK